MLQKKKKTFVLVGDRVFLLSTRASVSLVTVGAYIYTSLINCVHQKSEKSNAHHKHKGTRAAVSGQEYNRVV